MRLNLPGRAACPAGGISAAARTDTGQPAG